MVASYQGLIGFLALVILLSRTHAYGEILVSLRAMAARTSTWLLLSWNRWGAHLAQLEVRVLVKDLSGAAQYLSVLQLLLTEKLTVVIGN